MIPHIEISFRELETDQSKDMLWRCYVRLRKEGKQTLSGDNLILVFKSEFDGLCKQLADLQKNFSALENELKTLQELWKDE